MFDNINWMAFAGKPAIFGIIGLLAGWYISKKPFVALGAAVLLALASFAF